MCTYTPEDFAALFYKGVGAYFMTFCLLSCTSIPFRRKVSTLLGKNVLLFPLQCLSFSGGNKNNFYKISHESVSITLEKHLGALGKYGKYLPNAPKLEFVKLLIGLWAAKYKHILLQFYMKNIHVRIGVEPPQQAHDVNTTSPQRHDVASTLNRRCINVMCPPGQVLSTLVTALPLQF